MKIDIGSLPPSQQYKLLVATVVPRPIALVTTWSLEHGDNAAPFSCFNMMGEDPPTLVLGLERTRNTLDLKDTTVNIRDQGQFVVNMVDEALAEAMNACATAFPRGISEAAQAGLELVDCDKVRPRRIVSAPVAFECERIALLQLSPGRHIAIGRAVTMHVRDGLIDPDTLRIDTEAYRPVGRLFASYYVRTRDRFEMEIPTLPGPWGPGGAAPGELA